MAPRGAPTHGAVEQAMGGASGLHDGTVDSPRVSRVSTRWRSSVLTVVLLSLLAVPPVEVEVFVPLCDNALIQCGRPPAGAPRALETNLYWGRCTVRSGSSHGLLDSSW